MSNQEDHRNGKDKRRKSKSTVRVGDEVDGNKQGQSYAPGFNVGNVVPAISPMCNTPATTSTNTDSLSIFTFNPNQVHSSIAGNRSINSSPMQPLCSHANMQKLNQQREQYLKASAFDGRPTAANPVVPNTVQVQSPKAAWEVPIDHMPFSSTSPIRDESFPSFVPSFGKSREENQELGINPRKIHNPTNINPPNNAIPPTNSPIITTPLPPFKQTQPTTEQLVSSSQPSTRKSPSIRSNSPIANQQTSPLSINSPTFANNCVIAQRNPVYSQNSNSLITFLQQQWIILTNNFNEILRQWGANNRGFFNSPPPSLPPGHAKIFDKLNLDFSIFQNANLTKPYLIYDFTLGSNYYDPQQISMLPSKIDYFMLIKYFISQRIAESKTVNIYLVLDRLKNAIATKTTPCEINGKINEMKHLYPYLASIKKWKEVIRLNIDLLTKRLGELQGRHANLPSVVLEKATKLKTCAHQVKMSSPLVKTISSKCNVIAMQIKSAVELGRNTNNPAYSYTYPDQGMVDIFITVRQDYLDVLNKVNEIYDCLCAKQEHPEEQAPNKQEMIRLLDRRFNELSYQMIPIRKQLKRIRKELMEAKSWRVPPPFSEEWKTVDLFREIERIMERRRKETDH